MNRGGDLVTGGQPARGPDAYPGLLAALMAAIRPEFRADVLAVGRADPVLGGPSCMVAGCPRAAFARGICRSHYNRWQEEGRPDFTQFAASTGPVMHDPAGRVVHRSWLPVRPLRERAVQPASPGVAEGRKAGSGGLAGRPGRYRGNVCSSLLPGALVRAVGRGESPVVPAAPRPMAMGWQSRAGGVRRGMRGQAGRAGADRLPAAACAPADGSAVRRPAAPR
jgi:hypothetical protein